MLNSDSPRRVWMYQTTQTLPRNPLSQMAFPHSSKAGVNSLLLIGLLRSGSSNQKGWSSLFGSIYVAGRRATNYLRTPEVGSVPVTQMITDNWDHRSPVLLWLMQLGMRKGDKVNTARCKAVHGKKAEKDEYNRNQGSKSLLHVKSSGRGAFPFSSLYLPIYLQAQAGRWGRYLQGHNWKDKAGIFVQPSISQTDTMLFLDSK